MKKSNVVTFATIVLLFFITPPQSTTAQNYIGFTMAQIEAQFTGKYETRKEDNYGGIKTLSYKVHPDMPLQCYTFDTNGICIYYLSVFKGTDDYYTFKRTLADGKEYIYESTDADKTMRFKQTDKLGETFLWEVKLDLEHNCTLVGITRYVEKSK